MFLFYWETAKFLSLGSPSFNSHITSAFVSFYEATFGLGCYFSQLILQFR